MRTRSDPATGMLLYEGHDEPQRQGVPNPKEVDQPLTTPGGSWTENGKFFCGAMFAFIHHKPLMMHQFRRCPCASAVARTS